MSPTLVLAEGSGTSNSDDASHLPSTDKPASLKVVSRCNEHSVTTPLPPSQRGILLPTIVDPVTIVSILEGVLSCVHAIFDAIDKAQQADDAAHEALKALKRTVVDVEGDIKFFKTMIYVLQSTENEKILEFLEEFAISCCPLTVSILECAANPLLQV